MISEKFRPRQWSDFVGQPAIAEIEAACHDPWLFQGCGERWLFESDSIAGCGKTSCAYVAAMCLGCSEWSIERIDSRSCTVADVRALSGSMRHYGWGGASRRAYIIDEIHHLSRDCQRMLLGLLEELPDHVLVIGTTTSITWADEVDGLYSRFRRFRFRKPDARSIAGLCERVALDLGLPVPLGFRWLNYVNGKVGGTGCGNNIRAALDGMVDVLRRSTVGAESEAA